MATRKAEWSSAAQNNDGDRAEWYRLVRESSSVPVVHTRWSNFLHIDQFARSLIQAGIEYADVIETTNNPEQDLDWDSFEDTKSGYEHYLTELHRLADESLPCLISALVEMAGAVGAEWLQRPFGDWPTLLNTWSEPIMESPPTPASCAARTLMHTITTRWGLAAAPTPAQAAAVDIDIAVAGTFHGLKRSDQIELAQILITGIENVGLAAINTGIRPSLHSTHLPPENALQVRNDEPPF